ncbi:MAG: hypothetical protein ABID63_13280 [Pseudomonadota bacterium]
MPLSDHMDRLMNQQDLRWQTTSRRDMWTGLLDRLPEKDMRFTAFLDHYTQDGDITLSRHDVRDIYGHNPDFGLIAAILWVHFRGVRINALSLLVRDLSSLVQLFAPADLNDAAMSRILGQPGISIPTASKMLSACDKRFCGLRAAILDDTIIYVIESDDFRADFVETTCLRGKSRSRPIDYYKAYLQDLDRLARRMALSTDDIDQYLSILGAARSAPKTTGMPTRFADCVSC